VFPDASRKASASGRGRRDSDRMGRLVVVGKEAGGSRRVTDGVEGEERSTRCRLRQPWLSPVTTTWFPPSGDAAMAFMRWSMFVWGGVCE
jgi:hypothetical protein